MHRGIESVDGSSAKRYLINDPMRPTDRWLADRQLQLFTNSDVTYRQTLGQNAEHTNSVENPQIIINELRVSTVFFGYFGN